MRAITLLTAAVLLLGLALPGPAPAAGHGDERVRLCGQGLDANRLEGKSITRAKRIARRHACTVRIVRLNGEPLAVTQDYVTNRINVAVRDSTVRRVVGIF